MKFTFRRRFFGALMLAMLFAGCSGGHGASTLPAVATSPATTTSTDAPRTTSAVNTSVPAHVKTMAYWGLAGEPSGVPASWMVSHVTLLEAGAPQAASFKSAGGTYAMAYADPFRVASTDPMGNMAESAYLHSSSGSRIFTNGEGVTQYAVNPLSSVAVSGYASLSSSLRASAPYDFIEADNTYFDTLGAFYGFNASPVEVSSQSQWDTATNQLISASTIPVIVNGMSNEDGPNNGYSGSTMFLSNPNVAGGLDNEGCIESKDPAKSMTDWIFDENTLINMASQHKLAICWAMSNATNTNPVRNFFYASWLLSYDPTYSVIFPDIAPNFNRGSYLFVYPEEQIVPTAPVQTAVSRISELQVGSVYRREFGMCYQNQSSLAPCETIVNPSTATADISSLVSGYVQSMTLTDGLDAWNGGQVGWSSSVPTSLGPHTAVVLLKSASAAAPPPSTPTTATSGANLTGTIVANDGTYLVVNGCAGGGYVNAFFNSATKITTNGLSMTAGTPVSIVGTGSCSTSYQASSITLGTSSATTSTPATGATALTGTLVANDGTYLVVNGCAGGGYVNVFYTSSTPITTNGLSLTPGVRLSITGSGSCSTSYTASSITLGSSTAAAPAAAYALSGTIIANDGTYLVVNGCAGGGYVNVFFTSATPITTNGLKLAAGTTVHVVGSGSCSTSYTATSLTLGP